MPPTHGSPPTRPAPAPATPERTQARPTFAPAVDILERPDALQLMADMPGVNEGTVRVRLDKEVLTVTGQVKPKAPGERRLIHGEYSTGDYHRAFRLSEEVDATGIEATVKDGVLTVSLPKAKEASERSIPVRAG